MSGVFGCVGSDWNSTKIVRVWEFIVEGSSGLRNGFLRVGGDGACVWDGLGVWSDADLWGGGGGVKGWWVGL